MTANTYQAAAFSEGELRETPLGLTGSWREGGGQTFSPHMHSLLTVNFSTVSNGADWVSQVRLDYTDKALEHELNAIDSALVGL